MGVSHYWFSCCFEEWEYIPLSAQFNKADSESFLSERSIKGIEFWKKHDGNVNWFEPDGLHWNDFLCAFELNSYVEIAKGILPSELLTEERVYRFIIANRYTPVSILWYALGHQAAERLPGKMGNLLIHSSQVESTLKKVKSILNEVKLKRCIEKAVEYTGLDVDESTILEIITMLPDGLEKALQKKKGIFFLTSPQL